MPVMSIKFAGRGDDTLWPDLDRTTVIHTKDAISLGVLDGGMTSGSPSVALRIDLPDGRTVIAETSAKLFVGHGRLIAGRYPNLLD